MNELQIFQNDSFGQIRILEIDDEPWFAGKEVAEILGYVDTSKAIRQHIDEEDKLLIDTETQSRFGLELGQRGGYIINEPGFYDLVNHSKLETAKPFKKWVTHEVLPSIRKNGGYSIQHIQRTVDPYKPTVEQQIELQKEQNRSKELDYKVEKIALEKMKFEANKKASEQSTVKNPAVQSFSWNEPLKVEKTIRSSDWVNITELINEQLKPYFPDVKKSRKLAPNSLNDFLVENDYAERDFSELWSDGHYEDYTTIRFKEKGQELIQKGIVTYVKSSLKKNEDNVFYRTVCPKWHKTKAKDFFLEHQDEIKDFLMKPKKKSKKEPKKES